MKLSKLLPITLLISGCALDASDAATDNNDDDTDELITGERQGELAAAPSADLAALPAFRSRMTTTNGTSVMRPTGVVAGDFLIAALEYCATPVQVTPPAGWTLVHDQISGAGTSQVFHGLVYSHVATANEPAEYQFTAPAGVYVSAQVAAYTGVSRVEEHAGVGAFTSTITAPNLTTTIANQMLVSVFIDFEFGVWTTGTGLTQRSNFDANSLQDAIVPVPGPTQKRLASNTFGAQAAISLTLR